MGQGFGGHAQVRGIKACTGVWPAWQTNLQRRQHRCSQVRNSRTGRHKIKGYPLSECRRCVRLWLVGDSCSL